MKRFLIGMWLVALTLPVFGQSAMAVRKTAESSTLVTGVILVDEKGQVGEFQVDRPEKFTPTIIDFVNKNARAWRFEPQKQEGAPVKVRNRFSLRLVAKAQENGAYTIRINGVDFRPYAEPAGQEDQLNRKEELDAKALAALPRDRATVIKRARVSYPIGAAMVGEYGTVYLAVKITPDGNVADAIASKVNLGLAGTAEQMDAYRKQFAAAAIRGVKQWKVKYPSEGELAARPYLIGTVTVDFVLEGVKEPEYGEWRAYIPGPNVPIPWRDLGQDAPGYSPDAETGDGFRLAGEKGELKLLTPLGS